MANLKRQTLRRKLQTILDNMSKNKKGGIRSMSIITLLFHLGYVVISNMKLVICLILLALMSAIVGVLTGMDQDQLFKLVLIACLILGIVIFIGKSYVLESIFAGCTVLLFALMYKAPLILAVIFGLLAGAGTFAMAFHPISFIIRTALMTFIECAIALHYVKIYLVTNTAWVILFMVIVVAASLFSHYIVYSDMESSAV